MEGVLLLNHPKSLMLEILIKFKEGELRNLKSELKKKLF